MSKPPPQTRSILALIFRNFVNSLKPRRLNGDLIGKDYLGTKYYEIKAEPSLGRRRVRWFVPVVEDDFQTEVPTEWQAWLRGKRREPPDEEEIARNLALMRMKKMNAIEVDKKAGAMTPMTRGYETFPKRPEYEVVPGEHQRDT